MSHYIRIPINGHPDMLWHFGYYVISTECHTNANNNFACNIILNADFLASSNLIWTTSTAANFTLS